MKGPMTPTQKIISQIAPAVRERGIRPTAAASGLSPMGIRGILTRKTSPRGLDNLIKLAEAVGYDVTVTVTKRERTNEA
jgi:hypothetical protein